MKEHIQILDRLRPEEARFAFDPVNRNLCFGGGGGGIGGAISGAVSGITGMLGGGGGGAPQPGVSQSQLDPETRKMKKKVFDKTSEIMDRGYQGYTGDRFAGQSQDTQQAFKDIRGMQGRGQDAFSRAGQVGQDVSGYSADQVGQQSFLQGPSVGEYMSPHTKNVIEAAQQMGQENIQKNLQNQYAQNIGALGGGAGSRAALENATVRLEGMKNIDRATQDLLEKSFGQASQQKRQDMTMDQQRQLANQQAGMQSQDIRLRGAQADMAGAEAGRRAGYQDAQMLSQAGAQQEGYDQRQKDFDYDQFIEERDWDKNQAMFASNVLGGAPTGSTTTTTQPGGQSKKGGLGGAIMGGLGGWLQSGGSPWGAAAGALGGLS